MVDTPLVEDGSIVAGANTYVNVADAKAYASNRGVDLGVDNDAVAVMLYKAMDYLVQYADDWKGSIVETTQPLAWPRQDVILAGPGGDYYFGSDDIPQNLIDAQVQLAMAVHAGVDLMPTGIPGLSIIKEKIGPIETEYATPKEMGAVSWTSLSLPVVDALLAPLFEGDSFTLRTVRV